MSPLPYISVVIPVHNKRPHVRRAISSVLSQSWPGYEVIVVDDASRDGSLEEIEAFKDNRIKILRRKEPGPGGYAARNLAMHEARGEWVALLDADDEWSSDHLEKMWHAIQKFPEAALIGCGWISIQGNKSYTHRYFHLAQSRGIHKIHMRDYLSIWRRGERFCQTSGVVLNKAKALAVGGFPEGRTEKGGDLYLWIRLIAKYCGAWSPHIGAYVYRDSVNMVTKTAFFNRELISGVPAEVQVDLEPDEVVDLKKYVNSLLVKDYLRYCVSTRSKDVTWKKHYQIVGLHSYLIREAVAAAPCGCLALGQTVRRWFLR